MRLFNKIEVYDKVFSHCDDYGRNKKLEQLMATDCWYSFYYARDVIQDKFKLGEETIATNHLCNKYGYHAFLKGLP